MSSYNEFANKTRSSKVVLCHVEPKQRLTVFSNPSGNIYTKQVSHYVVDVIEDGTSLSEAANSSVTTGEWFYDSETSTLHINSSDDANPNTHTTVVKYRFFYSDRPIDLPYDLDSGDDVNYQGLIKSNSPINKELDDEQIGIVLESKTNLIFENTHGYFDDIYDTVIWENAEIRVWSFSETITIDQKRKLFDGIIEQKRFSPTVVTFTCKDSIYKLREPLSSENFTLADGDVPERYLYKPKRRIYGELDQLQCTPIDSVLDGFDVTGTVSGSPATSILTGTGTSFLDELSPEDQLFYNDGNQNYQFGIKSVDSDTQITLSDELEINVSGTITCKPKENWRKKNRRWHIAGHKLRAPSTTISEVFSARRFRLTDPSDFLSGDLVTVGSENVFIQSVSGNFVTLTAALNTGIPSVGVTVSKNPLRKAFLNGSEIFIDRDWSNTNTSTDAILIVDELSEFNISQAVDLGYNLTFTNGSRNITVSGINFKNEAKIRDWIRSDDITHTTWYEILDIVYDEATTTSTITTRIAYAGSTTTTDGQKKNVNIIDDTSIVLVNCTGKETDSTWVKTCSDIVKDLLEQDAGLSIINSDSFSTANDDAPFISSLALPKQIGGSNTKIREVISMVNRSVFGSLTLDSSQDFKYQVLTPEKPADMTELKDDDLITEPSINSKNEIVKKVSVKYGHFADKFTGEEAFNLYEFNSQFVDDLIGATSELELDIYLYNLDDATTIAQRYALYNSLSKSVITLKSKLNLSLFELNDKVQLYLDRIYKRLGARDRRKIGIVNKVSQNGNNTTLEINDLSNTFNRVANISDSAALDFTSAPDSEKIIYNYITDDDTLTPDTSSDDELYSNIIG